MAITRYKDKSKICFGKVEFDIVDSSNTNPCYALINRQSGGY
jgi:hypothetical protein